MPAEFDVQKPADTCLICGKRIADGPSHPSLLTEKKDGELERKDFCTECWAGIQGPGQAGQDYLCFWLTKRAKPQDTEAPRERKRKLKDYALNLFFSLREENIDDRFNFHLYLLAHVLLRLKAFRWHGTKSDRAAGRSMLIFEDSRDKQIIEIERLDKSEQEISEKTSQLIDKLLK